MAQLAEEANPTDIAQLLVAFTHFERYDADMLTVLEQVYVQILEQASGEASAAILIHHSKWAQKILKYDFKNIAKKERRKANKKNYMLSRNEKIFKKYNNELTEKIIDSLIVKVEEINVNALIRIQTNLLCNNISKNSTKRAILEFLVTGLKVFKHQRDSDTDLDLHDFEQLLGRYYEGIRKF